MQGQQQRRRRGRRQRPALPAWATSLAGLALALAAAAPGASANSMYLAQLCRGFHCTDPNLPLPEYSAERGGCACAPNPCWNDGGEQHMCLQPEFPHLHFVYSEAGELRCTCSKLARLDSVHIARDLCPGHTCEEEAHPILDWREAEGGCVCSSHPCWDDGGRRHSCDRPDFPILVYREPSAPAGGAGGLGGTCECARKMDPPYAGRGMFTTTPLPPDEDEEEEDEEGATAVYDFDTDEDDEF